MSTWHRRRLVAQQPDPVSLRPMSRALTVLMLTVIVIGVGKAGSDVPAWASVLMLAATAWVVVCVVAYRPWRAEQ